MKAEKKGRQLEIKLHKGELALAAARKVWIIHENIKFPYVLYVWY
jgi:hypothetical protein